ncbi:hypothetical protein DL769_000447 [Monosporascus sp. CRB-8-3]|nr:hypothetical protein DL769_000447 [Monosporascus sp. CRB-8-3]
MKVSPTRERTTSSPTPPSTNRPSRPYQYQSGLSSSTPLLLVLLLSTTAAASPAAPLWRNATAANATLTATLFPNSTSTLAPAPRPTAWSIECMGGALQDLCGKLCFCDGSPSCNCHYDPTSRCRQMCRCVPQV